MKSLSELTTDEAITGIRLDFTITHIRQKSVELVCTMISLLVQVHVGMDRRVIFFFSISRHSSDDFRLALT